MINYITKFGFGEGLVDYSVLTSSSLSDNGITEKIEKLSADFYSKTVSKLRENYDKVEKLAKKLIEEKTLSEDEITEFLDI